MLVDINAEALQSVKAELESIAASHANPPKATM